MLLKFSSLTFNFYPLYHSKAFFELYICPPRNGFEMMCYVHKPASSELKGLIVVRGPGRLTTLPSSPPEHRDTGGPEGKGKHGPPLSWHTGTLQPLRQESGEGWNGDVSSPLTFHPKSSLGACTLICALQSCVHREHRPVSKGWAWTQPRVLATLKWGQK